MSLVTPTVTLTAEIEVRTINFDGKINTHSDCHTRRGIIKVGEEINESGDCYNTVGEVPLNFVKS